MCADELLPRRGSDVAVLLCGTWHGIYLPSTALIKSPRANGAVACFLCVKLVCSCPRVIYSSSCLVRVVCVCLHHLSVHMADV